MSKKKNYAYLIGGKFTVEIVLPLALKFCKHLNFFSFQGQLNFFNVEIRIKPGLLIT